MPCSTLTTRYFRDLFRDAHPVVRWFAAHAGLLPPAAVTEADRGGFGGAGVGVGV